MHRLDQLRAVLRRRASLNLDQVGECFSSRAVLFGLLLALIRFDRDPYLRDTGTRETRLTGRQNVRTHLYGCATPPSVVRLRARAGREAARRVVKQAEQLRDRSDVLIREAEAALFERQRALREVMSSRTNQSLRNPPS